MLLFEICTGMKPSFREYRRDIRGNVKVGSRGEIVGFLKRRKLFCIILFHHSKPTKLTFNAIIKSMVITVTSDEKVATDEIESLNALNNLDGKRKSGCPWRTCDFVFEIELC